MKKICIGCIPALLKRYIKELKEEVEQWENYKYLTLGTIFLVILFVFVKSVS